MTVCQGRLKRARTQRLYIIEQVQPCADIILFRVMGSTGNLYDVELRSVPNRKWSCQCPDYQNYKSHCKHIYFVTERVLGLVPIASQTIPLTHWTAAIFRLGCQHPADSTAVAPELYQQRYYLLDKTFNQDLDDAKDESKLPVSQRPWIGEECAICMETMNEGGEAIIYCTKICGKSIHHKCFDMWARHQPEKITCPFCRAPGDWMGEQPKRKGKLIRTTPFPNLDNVLDPSL